MEKVRFVGLDVHKESVTIAVAEADGGPPSELGTFPHDVQRLLKKMKQMGKGATMRICYEAGPTGFGLCRALRGAGFDCVVIAPSMVPRQAGERIKNDRRDAVKLARFFRSGDLTPVFMPDSECEAVRDLERARYDAKKAEIAARNQLLKFLLRQGRRYEGKTNWTEPHMQWVRNQTFDHEAHNRVLVDYVHAVDEATARIKRLDKDIAQVVETWTLKPLVEAFQALRGVQILSAVVLAAELGDLTRFASAPELMAYAGLVPSEHSSGETVRRGHITHAGNRFVRRTLVEAAWNYRHRPSMAKDMRRRNRKVATDIQATAWKAQHRLHGRFYKLTARGKSSNKAVIAVARELAGFVWCIARQVAAQQPSSPSLTKARPLARATRAA
jgi:transposase